MTTALVNTNLTTNTYRTPAEDILKKGLGAMTIACEALTKQNSTLNKDVENLKQKLRLAQDKLIINSEEKE
tara:strand:+ start:3249 stop:3461 length:213 start_codon:yes stop_codon:yes gene_type:complete